MKRVERVSPGLAAALAQILFTHPRRHPRRAEEREVLARANHRFVVPTAHGRLRAWEWGDPGGPAILLVHGWEGRGSQLGGFVRPLVAAGYRVFAFDGPAHGDSRGQSTNLVDFADALLEVTRAVGPVAGVVAHSLGAAATTLALARDVSIERVVYIAPMFDVAEVVQGFGRRIGLGTATTALFARRMEALTGRPLALLEGARLAPAFGVPAWVAHDRADAEVPFTHSERLLAAWPDAALHRVVDLGHRRIVRDPDVIARAVAFLREGHPDLRSEEARIDRELFHRDERPGLVAKALPRPAVGVPRRGVDQPG